MKLMHEIDYYTSCILFRRAGRSLDFLLVQGENDYRVKQWKNVGGKSKPEDHGRPKKTMCREAKEELGLVIREAELTRTVFTYVPRNPIEGTWATFCFCKEITPEEEKQIKINTEELSRMAWISKKLLKKMLSAPTENIAGRGHKQSLTRFLEMVANGFIEQLEEELKNGQA